MENDGMEDIIHHTVERESKNNAGLQLQRFLLDDCKKYNISSEGADCTSV